MATYVSKRNPDPYQLMGHCIELAAPSQYEPRGIGAIVLSPQKEIIGRGYRRYGEIHGRDSYAELMALASVPEEKRDQIRGGTIFTTLEPVHQPYAPVSCADEIAKYGIHKVVIGYVDRNPKTSGLGINHLRIHSVRVELFDSLTDGIQRTLAASNVVRQRLYGDKYANADSILRDALMRSMFANER